VRFLRWLAKNFGTLLTAFILAVIVWVSAVIASDPNEQHKLDRPVPIEIVGQDPNLQIMDEIPQYVSVVLMAPTSVWTTLNNDPQTVTAKADLSNLGPGVHTVPVQVQVTPRQVRLISQDPEQISVTLDSIISQTFPVTLIVTGNPPTGYQAQAPIVNPENVVVTGAESLVSKVKVARISLDITNANQTIIRNEVPVLLDADGNVVSGLTLSPESVTVTQPITLLGGYRYVIVRAVTQGQVPTGYRVTNIFVSPIGVVVFSSNPELVNTLPGYVETMPIDLTGKEDDFETVVDLNLPAGITIVGDSKVLVQVSIAAVESSLAISMPVEVIGLSPGLAASISPPVVNVILTGPVPDLTALGSTDVRVVVDLTGYEEGTYQFTPQVNIIPERIQLSSVLPSAVEVTITIAPTPTQTTTPNGTQTPSPGPTATATPQG
jgi:YbbR domain-containing protein